MQVAAALLALIVGGSGAYQKLQVIPQQRPIDERLFAAVQAGDARKVGLLLAKGANANANEANGWRPLLMLDGTAEQRLAVAKLLVANGAAVGYRQPDQGWTPLTSEITRGASADLIRFFIDHGADVNTAMQDDGTTPLHLAVRYGSLGAVRILLAHGAKVGARTLLPARESAPTSPEIKKFLDRERQSESIRIEQEMADEFEPGFRFSGTTPAFELASRWSDSIADALVRAGANLDAVDDNRWTILHYAAKYANLDAVEALLKRGLNPNAASKGGYTPLHAAMRAGFGVPADAVIDKLVEAGSKLSARNKAGQTPVELLQSDLRRQFTALMMDGGPIGENETQAFKSENDLIARLDPSARRVEMPTLTVDALGTHYADLEFDDLKVKRSVRTEHGRTILDLVFDSFPEDTAFFTITGVQLGDAKRPLTPMPIRLRIPLVNGRHVLVEFPPTESKDRRVGIAYRYVDKDGRGGTGSSGYSGST